MSDPRIDKYRDMERKWRTEALNSPPGVICDSCSALAEGYDRLVVILESLEKEAKGGRLAALRAKSGPPKCSRQIASPPKIHEFYHSSRSPWNVSVPR